MKIILSLTFFFLSAILIAQTGRLTVYGKVQHKKSVLKGVKLEVYQDNELFKTLENTPNGSFKLELPMGSVYSVTYTKPKYIEKSVAILTKAADSTINGRFFYQLDIELFKEDDDEEDETMLPPVAKLYIKDSDSGFKFDKKYVKWVAEEYEEELED